LKKLTEKIKKMHQRMADVDEHINDGLTKTKGTVLLQCSSVFLISFHSDILESVMKLSEEAELGKHNIELIETDLSTLSDATSVCMS
jgi:hypothetical protein